jgi:hypothetical protein
MTGISYATGGISYISRLKSLEVSEKKRIFAAENGAFTRLAEWEIAGLWEELYNFADKTETDMKGLLLAVLLGMLPCAMSSEGTTVYISTGKSAEVYHRVITCRTLKRCREEGHVKSVPLEQAVRLRRRPCKVCYK